MVDNDWLVENKQIPYPFQEGMDKPLRDTIVDASISLADAIPPFTITSIDFDSPHITIVDSTGSTRMNATGTSSTIDGFKIYFFSDTYGNIQQSCILVTVDSAAGSHTLSDGVLVGRICHQITTLVNSISYESLTSTSPITLDSTVDFVYGYNVAYDMNGNTVEFDISAGSGLGECEVTLSSSEMPIYTVNFQSGDYLGTFMFTPSDCYWTDPEHSIVAAHVTVGGSIEVNGGCRPAITCDDYVDLYNRLKTVYDGLLSSRNTLGDIRDDYVSTITDWEDQMDCRKLRSTSLWAIAKPARRATVVIAIGNTDCTDIVQYSFVVSISGVSWIFDLNSGQRYDPENRWWYPFSFIPQPDFETATSIYSGIVGLIIKPARATILQFGITVADDEDHSINPTIHLELNGTFLRASGTTAYTHTLDLEWVD